MVATDRLITFSLSDVGRTRKENQDACGEFHNARGERLLVVADGMGGHAGGVTASRMCIESVARQFSSQDGTPGERLRRGLEEANHAVFAASEADPALHGMGTTGVALLFDPDDQVWLGWVGDSRAYRYRDGQLEQLSDDHSVVAEWVRQGVISPEEAITHPRRNELSRAIGPDSRVDVDIKSFPVEAGDIYLLCSDGLCGYMSDVDISAIVGFEDTEDAVRKLVDTVNVEQNSPDNVTVQIISVPSDNAAAGAEQGREEDEPYDEEYDDMENSEGYPRSKKMLIIGVALLIVMALLAGAAWYSQQAEISKIENQRVMEQQALAERARRDAELEAARVAEAAKKTEALRLQAKAAEEERARVEAEELARLAREEEAAREAALAKEIADAKAALLAEEAALAAEAAQVAAAQVAARERILAEQERRRQEAIALEEARAIEIAFNMAREVDAFVGEWVRALDEGDYALYKELGFRESENEFRALYPNNKAQYKIAVVEKKQWVGGFVALRVNEIYDPPGSGPGAEPQQTARRLVLRPTTSGMRFAGDRN